ncbi:hypothetical protein [Streptomyces sp. NPDC051132]|uniref:hypothetical protein n=1 Tax=unclassified Streptomyces TaxID=2593676 RepID=UPI00342C5978
MAALHRCLHRGQAHRPPKAREFVVGPRRSPTTSRAARTPRCPRELTAGQCALYRIGIRRHLGDVGTALAATRRLRPVQMPTIERRACAATDTASTSHAWCGSPSSRPPATKPS